MTYIILAAGKGTRLQPLTLDHSKSLFRLDENVTLIERTIRLIREYDPDPTIVVVIGYKHELFERMLQNVEFVYNPFFNVTNSIASLWMAREYMLAEDGVVILNGDVLLSNALMREVVCQPVDRSMVLLDSSIKSNGDYNVEVVNDRVIIMSKELKEYFGEYIGVTRLEHKGAIRLRQEIEHMVEREEYNQWYENALVRMIFSDDFALYYKDVCQYEWTEVDDVNDVVLAKRIYSTGI